MSNPEMSRMLAEANQSQQDFIHRWNRGERGPTSNFNYGPSRPYIPDASTSPVYFDGHQIVVVQRTPSPSARVPLSEVVEELIQKHWRENNMPGARHAAQPSPSPWPSSPPITERPVDNSLSPCLSSYKMPEADELFKPARTQVAYARRDPPTGLHSPGTWPTSDPALASSSTPYGIPPPKPPPDTLPMSSSTPVPSLGYNTWPTSDPAAALSSTPYGIQPGYYGPLITSNSLPPPETFGGYPTHVIQHTRPFTRLQHMAHIGPRSRVVQHTVWHSTRLLRPINHLQLVATPETFGGYPTHVIQHTRPFTRLHPAASLRTRGGYYPRLLSESFFGILHHG